MAELTDDQKRFIVKGWACYLESKEIADNFMEHFQEEGVELTRPTSAQLARYNPEYANGDTLAKELKSLFRLTRKRFEEDLTTIPAFHRAYRVRELNMLYKRQKKKSDVIAADLLKQIAQEKGGMFEQKQVAGSPAEIEAFIQSVATQLRGAVDRHVTDPEVRKRVNDDVKEIMEAAG